MFLQGFLPHGCPLFTSPHETGLSCNFHSTDEGVEGQRRIGIHPWSHSIGMADQSGACLDPNPTNSLSVALQFIPHPQNPRLEDKRGLGPWRHLCYSPAGSVFTSARVFWQHDRSPHEVARHLEDRGSATQGFPSVLSKAHISLSEPSGWGALAGIPNSSNLPADFNWRFCLRWECSAWPVAF